MDIVKGTWISGENKWSIAMPLMKIDKERRLVSGWASLDNLDTQGDIVLSDASKRAFERFRGNIREMHQPIAVGKMVEFKEDTIYDEKTGEMHKGIFVTVRVSKGAEATWQKVLDGTLSGFSIQGPINDSVREFSKEIGRPVHIIKDYDLNELSLVDSPANQLANVTTVMKFVETEEGTVMKGMIADVTTDNVYYCKEGVCGEGGTGIVKTSNENNLECPSGHEMANIGWIEYQNESEKGAEIAKLLSGRSEIVKTEGGKTMAEETVEKSADETVEVEETKEVVEKAAEETEVEANAENGAEEANFTKAIGELKDAIADGLEKNRNEAEAALASAMERFENSTAEIKKSLEEKHSELVEKFATLKGEVEKVEKVLDGVVSETAVKKSGDLGGSTEPETLTKRKGVWAGSILD